MNSLDPQTRALLKDYAALATHWATRLQNGNIADARAFADAMFAQFRGASHDLRPETVIDMMVPGANGSGDGERPARLYRPARAGPQAPGVILFLHGGGWAFGGIEAYDALIGSLAALSGVAVLSLEYRLAPEHPFPAGLHDALAALQWLASHASTVGCDPTRLAVMGDSAGGNLAAVTALAAAADGPHLCAQFLLYPMTDLQAPHDAYPSRQAYGAGDYFLTNTSIDFARDTYLGGTGIGVEDPRVSPLLAPIPSSLAPAMIITAGHDPLRDEAKAYHHRLVEAGVTSRYVCAQAMVHGFLSFGVLDGAQTMRRTLAQALRDALDNQD